MPTKTTTTTTTTTDTSTEETPVVVEEKNNGGKKKAAKKSTKQNKGWLWPLLAGLGTGLAFSCFVCRGCCGTEKEGCRDCDESDKDTVWVVKDDPSITVGGDAIIINGDNNDATMIKGNGNNAANRSSGEQNVASWPVRKPVKPIVKPAPVIEPTPVVKPEPQPEEQTCTTTTTTTRTRVIISGDANDVTRAAVAILNGNCR